MLSILLVPIETVIFFFLFLNLFCTFIYCLYVYQWVWVRGQFVDKNCVPSACLAVYKSVLVFSKYLSHPIESLRSSRDCHLLLFQRLINTSSIAFPLLILGLIVDFFLLNQSLAHWHLALLLLLTGNILVFNLHLVHKCVRYLLFEDYSKYLCYWIFNESYYIR